MSFAALPNAVLFAVVGLGLFTVALITLLRVLPGRLWNRALEDGNMAAAVIVAAIEVEPRGLPPLAGRGIGSAVRKYRWFLPMSPLFSHPENS